MLRIRFSRTGKVGQPSFRIVIAEHRSPVKGRYMEMLGHYMPARKPKVIVVNKERVSYWISKGAIPSDSVASLLKKQGMDNMDKFIAPRAKKRSSKGEKGEKQAESAPKPEEQKAAPAA